MNYKASNSSAVKRAYDQLASHYRDYSLQRNNYIISVNQLIENSCKNKYQRVLDFGCGDGKRGAELYKIINASYLVQADISEMMLARCAENGAANEVWDVSDLSDIESHKTFDLIFCLWNVVGHIQTFEERVKTLKWLKELLLPQGKIYFDVNNRHYRGYGIFKTIYRRLIDFLYPKYSRGDVNFSWNIGNELIPINGHLFTFCEIEHACKEAGLVIEDWWAIDYENGVISKRVCRGQLLFVVRKKI